MVRIKKYKFLQYVWKTRAIMRVDVCLTFWHTYPSIHIYSIKFVSLVFDCNFISLTLTQCPTVTFSLLSLSLSVFFLLLQNDAHNQTHSAKRLTVYHLNGQSVQVVSRSPRPQEVGFIVFFGSSQTTQREAKMELRQVVQRERPPPPPPPPPAATHLQTHWRNFESHAWPSCASVYSVHGVLWRCRRSQQARDRRRRCNSGRGGGCRGCCSGRRRRRQAD